MELGLVGLMFVIDTFSDVDNGVTTKRDCGGRIYTDQNSRRGRFSEEDLVVCWSVLLLLSSD